MDLRNNEDDRPYRSVNRSGFNTPSQYDYGYDEDTISTQAYYRARIRSLTEQRWFPLAAVTLGVILFGSLIAFAYRSGADNTANGTTPLIQAENGSYKAKPQDPGGMEVPFQDAVVFDQLDKSKTANAGEKVENLLPPPEQPVEEAKATTDTKTVAENAADKSERAVEATPPSAPKENTDKSVIADKTGDSVADKIAATEADMKAKTETAETASVTETKVTETKPTDTTTTTTQVTEKTESTKAIPLKTAAVNTTKTTTMDDVVKTTTASTTPSKMNAVAPAATTPAPAKTGGTTKVQLGAFKDESAARTAWAQFQKTYAPHLNGVTPNYARADLGAKGVFYRVQGVNLSKTQAQDICKSINATKPGACILAQ